MMRITALLLLTGSTLLHFGGQAQAQIQSLSYTAKPKIIQTPDNQPPSTKLYVTPKGQAPQAGNAAGTTANDPLGLEARDLDENAKQEMDRVFELYKTLSAQQSADAAQKPMKTEPTSNKSGEEAMRTLKPSASAATTETQKATPGSFASIIERYKQKKAGGTTTNSMNISNPAKLARSGNPPQDTPDENTRNRYNQ